MMEASAYCGYTENPYPSSQSPPLGVTFKGKARSYLDGHSKLLDMVANAKGEVFVTNGNKWKVLDVKPLKTMIDAVVEVGSKWNANLKI